VLGAVSLPNRIIMAPLTAAEPIQKAACRSDLAVAYYRQRASAGLIVSDSDQCHAMGVGYPARPASGLTNRQMAGKMSPKRSIAEGGRILLQLWHVGRISDPMFLGGATPVSASAAAKPAGRVSLVRPEREFVTPRALETAEIPRRHRRFQGRSAECPEGRLRRRGDSRRQRLPARPVPAGQTNHRTDTYGGSRENRARLMLEVADAVSEVWGANRVACIWRRAWTATIWATAIRWRPSVMSRASLGRRGFAFLCTREKQADDSLNPALKEAFGGAFIANEGFTRETAERTLAEVQLPMRWRSASFSSPIPIAGAIRAPRAAQRLGQQNFLFRWRGRLYGLSGSSGGTRIGTMSCLTPFSPRIPRHQGSGGKDETCRQIAAAALLVLGAGTVSASADACSGRSHDTGTALGAVGGGLIAAWAPIAWPAVLAARLSAAWPAMPLPAAMIATITPPAFTGNPITSVVMVTGTITGARRSRL